MPEVQNGNSPEIWNHVPQDQVCLDFFNEWNINNTKISNEAAIRQENQYYSFYYLFRICHFIKNKVNYDTTTARETALTSGKRNTPRFGSHITSIILSLNLTFLMWS